MARGDHIKVWRCGGLYSHHGIDLGDGTVIHFAGEPFRTCDAKVVRADMAEFLAGGTAAVVHHPQSRRTADAVVASALEQLHRSEYCLWRNNCEHFATFCKTGRRHSRQVLNAFRAAGVVISAAGTAAAVVALTTRRRGNTV